ncbi:MAG: hypothetical protein ACQESP_06795 [Candidatus Muiribacteriota bacterium]
MFSDKKIKLLLIVLVFLLAGCGEEKEQQTEKEDRKPSDFTGRDLPLLDENSQEQYIGLELIEEFKVEDFRTDFETLNIPVDEGGNIYLIDPNSRNIRKYSQTGELVDEFNTGLPQPSAIHYREGSFFVLDSRQQIIYRTDKNFDITGRIFEGKPIEERKGNYRISIDHRGNIFILNYEDGIIEVFTSEFRKVREFRGDFSGDIRLEANYKDKILAVADVNNHTMYVFDMRNGDLMYEFGKPGSGEGRLGSFFDITLLEGRIYLADYDNNRLQIVNSENGELIKAVGAEGTGDGQFVRPVSVWGDETGLVFVLEKSGHRVQVFDKDGNFVRKFGEYGSDDGELNSPELIFGLPELGFLFVLDDDGSRMQTFTYTGDFIRKYNILSDYLDYTFGIIADSGDGLFIVSPEGQRVIKYDIEQMLSNVPSGQNTASNIAVDENGHMLFVNRDTMRLQYNEMDGRKLNVNYDISAEKSPDIEVKIDYFTLDSENNIYILDRYNHRVLKYNSEGTLQKSFGTNRDTVGDFRLDSGSGRGEFRNPFFITVDFNDNLYVADIGNNRIQKFNKNGEFVTEFGRPGAGEGTFTGRFTFAISNEGLIFVNDYARSRVQIFDITGDFISVYGQFGDRDIDFVNPMGINIGDERKIYIFNSKTTDAFANVDDLSLKITKKADLYSIALSYYKQRRFEEALHYFYEVSHYKDIDKVLFYGWYCADKRGDFEKLDYFSEKIKSTPRLSDKIKNYLDREGFSL